MNNFTVGQKVVCIREGVSKRRQYREERHPKVGEVYTIRAIVPGDCGDGPEPALYLVEIVNRPLLYRTTGGKEIVEMSFLASRFRPVKTASIESLERLLLTENQPTGYIEIWDNRRKQKAPARGH